MKDSQGSLSGTHFNASSFIRAIALRFLGKRHNIRVDIFVFRIANDALAGFYYTASSDLMEHLKQRELKQVKLLIF
ncbi:hypothetical protein BKI52_31405 [marine bacterium AO1-C]|nr:hypothetical protein BKI52_31405 [marine bacterium AO1-C]